jgi:NOL1/NOP2/fmu family ribosome biogenesis protein
VIESLKQNGTLIYSTCSYSKLENEEISDWLFETFELESIRIPIDTKWGIVETKSDDHQCYGYRFYPHKVRGEGFFIAAFRKKSASAFPQIRRARENTVNIKNEEIIRRWLIDSPGIRLINLQEEFFAIPAGLEADLSYLQSRLYLKKSGIRIGKVMGKDLVPNHELAVSRLNNPDVHRINLTHDQSISYLKREELRLESDHRGWVLMCFEEQPLGWAKILDNRLNNYFPKEIRITNPNVV